MQVGDRRPVPALPIPAGGSAPATPLSNLRAIREGMEPADVEIVTGAS